LTSGPNFIVTAHKGSVNALAASVTDAELVAELKVWLENRGFVVLVKDHTRHMPEAEGAD